MRFQVPPSGGSLEIGNTITDNGSADYTEQQLNGCDPLRVWAKHELNVSVPPSGGSLEIGNPGMARSSMGINCS